MRHLPASFRALWTRERSWRVFSSPSEWHICPSITRSYMFSPNPLPEVTWKGRWISPQDRICSLSFCHLKHIGQIKGCHFRPDITLSKGNSHAPEQRRYPEHKVFPILNPPQVPGPQPLRMDSSWGNIWLPFSPRICAMIFSILLNGLPVLWRWSGDSRVPRDHQHAAQNPEVWWFAFDRNFSASGVSRRCHWIFWENQWSKPVWIISTPRLLAAGFPGNIGNGTGAAGIWVNNPISTAATSTRVVVKAKRWFQISSRIWFLDSVRFFHSESLLLLFLISILSWQTGRAYAKHGTVQLSMPMPILSPSASDRFPELIYHHCIDHSLDIFAYIIFWLIAWQEGTGSVHIIEHVLNRPKAFPVRLSGCYSWMFSRRSSKPATKVF